MSDEPVQIPRIFGLHPPWPSWDLAKWFHDLEDDETQEIP